MGKHNPYEGLAEADKPAVNVLVNDIFAQKTGVTRKLGTNETELVSQWLAILHTVIRHQDKFFSWIKPVGVRPSPKAAFDVYQNLNPAPSWIKIARDQLGQKEFPGRAHNPQIMNYIFTCTNILETDKQRKYVEREGEEGVEWCSAYVNWCMIQAGIAGTNNALASSWKTWGQALKGPQVGAIALFSWNGTKINHVAFIDEVDGKFKMLGGNQSGAGSKEANQVSSRPFPQSAVWHYRWPSGLATP